MCNIKRVIKYPSTSVTSSAGSGAIVLTLVSLWKLQTLWTTNVMLTVSWTAMFKTFVGFHFSANKLRPKMHWLTYFSYFSDKYLWRSKAFQPAWKIANNHRCANVLLRVPVKKFCRSAHSMHDKGMAKTHLMAYFFWLTVYTVRTAVYT